MSLSGIERAIEHYAKAAGKPLSPHWKRELGEVDLGEGPEALATIATTLGWESLRQVR